MARPKQRIGIDRESRSLQRVTRSEPGHSTGGTSSSSKELALGDEPSVDTTESGGLGPETWLEDAMQQHQEAKITPPQEQPQNCTVAGEHVTTADVQVEPAPAARNSANSPAAQEKGFDCTTCGKVYMRTWDIMEHPQLGVGICKHCKDFLFSSPYTKSPVDGSEEQCRWCGEGGEIVMCDDCDRAFCQGCIVRNFSRHDLHAIVSSVHWSCYSCKPEALRDHVEEFKRFKANATNFPRTSNGDPTIAELLAQGEERMRQNPVQRPKPRGKPGRKTAAPSSKKKILVSHQTGINKRQSNQTIAEIVRNGAPSSQTPVVSYIRPHQMIEKRREAAERRRRAELHLKNTTIDNNEKNMVTDHNEKNMVTDHNEKPIFIINHNDEKKVMVAQVKSEYGDGEKLNVEKRVFFSEVRSGDLMQTTEDAFGATAKNLFANFSGISKP